MIVNLLYSGCVCEKIRWEMGVKAMWLSWKFNSISLPQDNTCDVYILVNPLPKKILEVANSKLGYMKPPQRTRFSTIHQRSETKNVNSFLRLLKILLKKLRDFFFLERKTKKRLRISCCSDDDVLTNNKRNILFYWTNQLLQKCIRKSFNLPTFVLKI